MKEKKNAGLISLIGICMMLIGFGLLLWGKTLNYESSDIVIISVVTVVLGVFLGFLLFLSGICLYFEDKQNKKILKENEEYYQKMNQKHCKEA